MYMFSHFVTICIEAKYTHSRTHKAHCIFMGFMRHNVLSVHALPELFGFNEINYILPVFSRPKIVHADLPGHRETSPLNGVIIIFITLLFFGNTWRLRVKYDFSLVNSNNALPLSFIECDGDGDGDSGIEYGKIPTKIFGNCKNGINPTCLGVFLYATKASKALPSISTVTRQLNSYMYEKLFGACFMLYSRNQDIFPFARDTFIFFTA